MLDCAATPQPPELCHREETPAPSWANSVERQTAPQPAWRAGDHPPGRPDPDRSKRVQSPCAAARSPFPPKAASRRQMRLAPLLITGLFREYGPDPGRVSPLSSRFWAWGLDRTRPAPVRRLRHRPAWRHPRRDHSNGGPLPAGQSRLPPPHQRRFRPVPTCASQLGWQRHRSTSQRRTIPVPLAVTPACSPLSLYLIQF